MGSSSPTWCPPSPGGRGGRLQPAAHQDAPIRRACPRATDVTGHRAHGGPSRRCDGNHTARGSAGWPRACDASSDLAALRNVRPRIVPSASKPSPRCQGGCDEPRRGVRLEEKPGLHGHDRQGSIHARGGSGFFAPRRHQCQRGRSFRTSRRQLRRSPSPPERRPRDRGREPAHRTHAPTRAVLRAHDLRRDRCDRDEGDHSGRWWPRTRRPPSSSYCLPASRRRDDDGRTADAWTSRTAPGRIRRRRTGSSRSSIFPSSRTDHVHASGIDHTCHPDRDRDRTHDRRRCRTRCAPDPTSWLAPLRPGLAVAGPSIHTRRPYVPLVSHGKRLSSQGGRRARLAPAEWSRERFEGIFFVSPPARSGRSRRARARPDCAAPSARPPPRSLQPARSNGRLGTGETSRRCGRRAAGRRRRRCSARGTGETSRRCGPIAPRAGVRRT